MRMQKQQVQHFSKLLPGNILWELIMEGLQYHRCPHPRYFKSPNILFPGMKLILESQSCYRGKNIEGIWYSNRHDTWQMLENASKPFIVKSVQAHKTWKVVGVSTPSSSPRDSVSSEKGEMGQESQRWAWRASLEVKRLTGRQFSNWSIITCTSAGHTMFVVGWSETDIYIPKEE